MKLAKSKLKQIIKEELNKVLLEKSTTNSSKTGKSRAQRMADSPVASLLALGARGKIEDWQSKQAEDPKWVFAQFAELRKLYEAQNKTIGRIIHHVERNRQEHDKRLGQIEQELKMIMERTFGLPGTTGENV